jgi:hypothetical protein
MIGFRGFAVSWQQAMKDAARLRLAAFDSRDRISRADQMIRDWPSRERPDEHM